MCFSLEEGRKRRGRRGINISSGSGTGDFEGMLRIEVGQETATSVGGGEGRIAIRLMCTQILITSLFTGSIRGECDTHSCPDTLSYDRFSMNRKRPTAYDGSGALFLGRRRTLSVGPPSGCFTVYSSGRWMSGLPSPPSLGGWGCSGLSGFLGSLG